MFVYSMSLFKSAGTFTKLANKWVQKEVNADCCATLKRPIQRLYFYGLLGLWEEILGSPNLSLVANKGVFSRTFYSTAGSSALGEIMLANHSMPSCTAGSVLGHHCTQTYSCCSGKREYAASPSVIVCVEATPQESR